MIRPIPRLTRWRMLHGDDLALVGDRFVIAACVIAIALYAFGVIA